MHFEEHCGEFMQIVFFFRVPPPGVGAKDIVLSSWLQVPVMASKTTLKFTLEQQGSVDTFLDAVGSGE